VLGAARRTSLDELRGLLVLRIVMTVAACGDGMNWLESLRGVAELELLLGLWSFRAGFPMVNECIFNLLMVFNL
jgi:hypothetical protein